MKDSYDNARDFLHTQQMNEGFNEQQYHAYDNFTTQMQLAWENWEDDVTREYWGSDEKPTLATREFSEMYIDNATDEELAPIVEAFDFEDCLYFLNLTENDVVRDIETLIAEGTSPRTESGVTGWAEFCRTNYPGFDELDDFYKEELYAVCESIMNTLEQV